MNLGVQDKKKLGILGIVGVFGLAAAYYIYTELFPPEPPPIANPVTATTPTTSTAPTAMVSARRTASGNTVGVANKTAGSSGDRQLDPTLHMEAMLVTESLVYTGNGRNIFSANSVPEASIPRPIARVRTPEVIAPVRTGPVGPPPPPPIDLKFFGTETNATGGRRAFLLHGEDVFLVSSGDIVQRRYRVVSIDARSIMIEDIANNDRQSLPLLSN